MSKSPVIKVLKTDGKSKDRQSLHDTCVYCGREAVVYAWCNTHQSQIMMMKSAYEKRLAETNGNLVSKEAQKVVERKLKARDITVCTCQDLPSLICPVHPGRQLRGPM